MYVWHNYVWHSFDVSPTLTESSWERPADLPASGESGSGPGPSGETVGPPGVDDPSALQPEPLSGEDSSNSTNGAGEGEESKQVTKIQFRVRLWVLNTTPLVVNGHKQ